MSRDLMHKINLAITFDSRRAQEYHWNLMAHTPNSTQRDIKTFSKPCTHKSGTVQAGDDHDLSLSLSLSMFQIQRNVVDELEWDSLHVAAHPIQSAHKIGQMNSC